MADSCKICGKTLGNISTSIVCCSGICKNNFHVQCVKLSPEILRCIKSNIGLSWRCNVCRESPLSAEFYDMVESKCAKMFENMMKKFENFKSELCAEFNEKITANNLVSAQPPTSPTLYSQKLIGNPKSKILIKPKNVEQPRSCTENDFIDTVDPLNADLKITEVKSLPNGTVLISYDGPTGNPEIKRLTESRLSEKYNIRELKPISPSVRIVGISDNFTEDSVLNYIIKQNCSLIKSDSQITLKKFWPTHRNDKIYQAILDVDINTYNTLIKRGHILVGLTSCAVYDAISVTRCFKCNGFNHVSKYCKHVEKCPHCAGPHTKDKCTASNEEPKKCVNCIQLQHNLPDIKIDINHPASDQINCTAYKKALAKFKADLFEINTDSS